MMEDATRIANLISDRDIHNGDVTLQNAIVWWDSNASKYKAMMIDFGQCVLTNATHDKRGWKRQQQARMRKAPWKGICRWEVWLTIIFEIGYHERRGIWRRPGLWRWFFCNTIWLNIITSRLNKVYLIGNSIGKHG